MNDKDIKYYKYNIYECRGYLESENPVKIVTEKENV